jgi:double-stranded uracil-DNA glycosylase
MPAVTAPSPPPLADRVAPDLDVLFVGINPSLHSAEVGHHFASKGNPFWRLLHAAGLTAELLAPADDVALPAHGLGVTNVCSRATRSAAELERAELREGARALAEKVAALRPRIVALVGVSLYPLVFPRGREPGPGAKRAQLAGARVFVLPNPSGLNAAYPGFQHKLVWFRRLARLAGRAPACTERPGRGEPDRDPENPASSRRRS